MKDKTISIHSMEQKEALSQAIKKLKSDVLELSNNSSDVSLHSLTTIIDDYHSVVANLFSDSLVLQGKVFDDLRWFVSDKDNVGTVGETNLDGVLSMIELRRVFLTLYNAIMYLELKITGNIIPLRRVLSHLRVILACVVSMCGSYYNQLISRTAVALCGVKVGVVDVMELII